MSLIVGGELLPPPPPPVVAIIRLQPPAIPPCDGACSSYTYNDHVPLAASPLNELANFTGPYGPAGAGAGKLLSEKLPLVVAQSVGLNCSDHNSNDSGNTKGDASVRAAVTLVTEPLDTREKTTIPWPVGPTSSICTSWID